MNDSYWKNTNGGGEPITVEKVLELQQRTWEGGDQPIIDIISAAEWRRRVGTDPD